MKPFKNSLSSFNHLMARIRKEEDMWIYLGFHCLTWIGFCRFHPTAFHISLSSHPLSSYPCQKKINNKNGNRFDSAKFKCHTEQLGSVLGVGESAEGWPLGWLRGRVVGQSSHSTIVAAMCTTAAYTSVQNIFIFIVSAVFFVTLAFSSHTDNSGTQFEYWINDGSITINISKVCHYVFI